MTKEYRERLLKHYESTGDTKNYEELKQYMLKTKINQEMRAKSLEIAKQDVKKPKGRKQPI